MTAIDISYWQGHPDFAQVKASGVSRVLMKAADGERNLYVDSVYVANRTAARAAGLAVGSYFFNGPAASPAASADYYLAVIDYRPGDVVAVDVEGPAGIMWNPGQVLEFVNRVKQVLGIAPLVYMSSSVTRALDWSAVVAAGAPLWVAQYGSNDGTAQGTPNIGHWGSWAMWQYTSTATCPGVAGHVDTNQMNGAFAGLGETLLTSTTPPIPIGDDMLSALVYNVQSSDPAHPDNMQGAFFLVSPTVITNVTASTGAYLAGQLNVDTVAQSQASTGVPIKLTQQGLSYITAGLGVPVGTLEGLYVSNGVKSWRPSTTVDLTTVLAAISSIPVATSAAVDLTPVLAAIKAIPVAPRTFVGQ